MFLFRSACFPLVAIENYTLAMTTMDLLLLDCILQQRINCYTSDLNCCPFYVFVGSIQYASKATMPT